MPLTHWHSEWVFSLILTLSRHNFLDLGSSMGCAGQKGSWDWPEGSQALQHWGIYLDTIRNGPEPWNSGKNPNSPEAGVMGEPCIWVSPVEILTSQLIHSQNFPKSLPGFTLWWIFLNNLLSGRTWWSFSAELSVWFFCLDLSPWVTWKSSSVMKNNKREA